MAVQVLPSWAGGILIAALIAAIMSTADSLLLASTSHVINDLYVPLMKIHSSIDNKKLLKISKITTILIGVFALAVSLLIPQIITILIYSYTFYTSGVVVPVIVGMYWKKGNEYGALAAIIVGGATALLGIFKLLPIGSIPAAIVGIGISFITYIIVSLLTNKNEITEINEAM